MAHKWAEWLHHHCLLGIPQCLARGENQKWPTSGHNGYITGVFSGLPNADQGEKITNGPQVGTMATSPLPSWGTPMPSKGRKSEMAHKWAHWLHHPCLLGAPQQLARRKNQKGPISRQSGYITPAFSGIPNAQQGEKIRNGPQVGIVATFLLPFWGSPMPSTERKTKMAHMWG